MKVIIAISTVAAKFGITNKKEFSLITSTNKNTLKNTNSTHPEYTHPPISIEKSLNLKALKKMNSR